ncbi:nucleolar transcription factor 1-like [Sitodiplosis mosellana]|uniref:nucleolar transcription factor 1-like n=1 Tax=Sitodiplosis mosellana TaxID=263140 RepID=UPI002443A18A|nr:nucleolar transcription factor 1-like [Sitodiplosis mosellana]
MRLNTVQKAEILIKLNDGVNGNRLAKEYGVAKSTISLLKKRKYDEMMNPSKRSGTFNQPSSASESNNESNQSKNASNEDEIDDEVNDNVDGDERVEKKSHALPMFRQLKLYKPSTEMDGNEHDDDDVADEYEDDEEEEDASEGDEEDFNEICRKLRRLNH